MIGRVIRVLEFRSVRGTGGGPEKTILQGAALANRQRVHVTVCYLRDARDDVFGIDQRAGDLGVDYAEIVERHSFDPTVWRRVRDLVLERRIDVVHAHEYKTDLLALILRKRLGVAALATAHGWTGHSARERMLYYPMDRRVLARLPLVVAVSGQIRDTLIGAGADPARIEVLLNGIDAASFRRDPARVEAARRRFGVPAGAFAIGSVGRLEPQKRFDLLIDAVETLRRQGRQVHLLIAGDGSLRDRLAAQLPAGQRSSSTVVGHLDDVIEFHHALDLFVQSSDYEGTPNVVLEAMALETPIVATNVGGTAEVCRPGLDGLIVSPGSVATLTAAIDTALNDEVGRRARAARARERVETDLSFTRRLRALEDLYVRVAAEAPR